MSISPFLMQHKRLDARNCSKRKWSSSISSFQVEVCHLSEKAEGKWPTLRGGVGVKPANDKLIQIWLGNER